jgi:hypothetical protein
MSWQIENFLNPVNTMIMVLGLLAEYVVFYIMYIEEKKEFINIFDMKFSIFEQETLKKWGTYFFWALLQQSIVLIPMHFLELNVQWKYFLSVIIFGCLFHFPNWKLMLFTSIFGGIFYGFWFFTGSQSLVYLALLHGFGGTCYAKLGREMRVWRFDIKY